MADYFINLKDTGRDVVRLQQFLFAEGFFGHRIDGQFRADTFEAVERLQQRLGVEADGVYGSETETAATRVFPATVFRLPTPPATRPPIFPARPENLAAPSLDFTEATFERFRFEPGRFDGTHTHINILGDWESRNIVKLEVPELADVTINGKRQDRVTLRVHRLIKDQLRAMFIALGEAGLAPWIITFDGAFFARLKAKRTEPTRGNISNHAYGTAFDVNASQNPFSKPSAPSGSRGNVRELVAIANAHGFFWGGHFGGSEDGMHFECARVL